MEQEEVGESFLPKGAFCGCQSWVQAVGGPGARV